jgi:hypothetical protein
MYFWNKMKNNCLNSRKLSKFLNCNIFNANVFEIKWYFGWVVKSLCRTEKGEDGGSGVLVQNIKSIDFSIFNHNSFSNVSVHVCKCIMFDIVVRHTFLKRNYE